MSGVEVAIEWNGRPAPRLGARPARRSFVRSTCATSPTLRNGRRAGFCGSATGCRAAGEPLARLLLHAEGIASSNIEGLRVPSAQVATAGTERTTESPAGPRGS